MSADKSIVKVGRLHRAHTVMETPNAQVSALKKFRSEVNEDNAGHVRWPSAMKEKEPKYSEKKKKEVSQLGRKKEKKTKARRKSENILCAIIALMRELEKPGLEFIQKDAAKRIRRIELAEQRVAYSSEEDEAEASDESDEADIDEFLGRGPTVNSQIKAKHAIKNSHPKRHAFKPPQDDSSDGEEF